MNGRTERGSRSSASCTAAAKRDFAAWALVRVWASLTMRWLSCACLPPPRSALALAASATTRPKDTTESRHGLGDEAVRKRVTERGRAEPRSTIRPVLAATCQLTASEIAFELLVPARKYTDKLGLAENFL